MVSNGRNVSSAGCISGAGVGDAHTGVQCQWIDETGILSAARNLREELLLLAQEVADADGRVCGSSAGAVRAGSDYGGCLYDFDEGIQLRRLDTSLNYTHMGGADVNDLSQFLLSQMCSFSGLFDFASDSDHVHLYPSF